MALVVIIPNIPMETATKCFFYNSLFLFVKIVEVKFTYLKINYFKMNNSVAFSTFTVIYYLCLVPKYFHHSKVKLLS